MSIAERKIKSLIDDGHEAIGVILQKDGKRVTVDNFGRVQWWTTYGTGEMVSSHAGELMDENNRMFSRIADLEEALKIAVVKLQGEQDPIGWPIERFGDVIAGRPFR